MKKHRETAPPTWDLEPEGGHEETKKRRNEETKKRGNEETKKRGNEETKQRRNEETKKRGNEDITYDVHISHQYHIYIYIFNMHIIYLNLK